MKRTFVKKPGSSLFLPADLGREGVPPGKRRVYSDGVHVGDIDRTGDELKDAESASALLRSKGIKPPSRLRVMFLVAASFSATARGLLKGPLAQVPTQPTAIVPFVVNAAFSIEVYLKALRASLGKQRNTGHNLLALFDSLPQELREGIQARATLLAKNYKLDGPVDFRAHLAQLNNAFSQWRYLYEHPSLGIVNVQPTVLVMHTLHEIAGGRCRP